MSNAAYLLFAYFLALFGSALLASYVIYSLSPIFSELVSGLLASKPARAFRKVFSSSIGLMALLGFSTISMTNSCARINTYADVIADKVYVYDRAREQISTSAMYLFLVLVIWGLVVSILIIARKKPRKEHRS